MSQGSAGLPRHVSRTRLLFSFYKVEKSKAKWTYGDSQGSGNDASNVSLLIVGCVCHRIKDKWPPSREPEVERVHEASCNSSAVTEKSAIAR